MEQPMAITGKEELFFEKTLVFIGIDLYDSIR